MKKVLFATTALIATAGIASAEVSLKGLGTMGVLDADSMGGTQLIQNVDLYIRMSGESDNGLSFSAGADLEALETYGTAGKSGANSSSGSFVSVSGAFGTLTLGNTDGAIDKSLTEVHRLFGLDLEQGFNYVDNNDNNNILRYDYSFGDVAVAASFADTDDAVGVGVRWSGDMGGNAVSLGLGYEDSDLGDLLGVSAGMTFDAFEVRAAYWSGDNNGDTEQLDVSAQYSANGLSVGANYRDNQVTDALDSWMVYATYDLGGGASVFAHTGESSFRPGMAVEDMTVVGMSFSF